MIAEIDKDHYASILRAIYFGTMSAKDYPIDQGYQELVGRMKTEEPGSIRWLLMASVRAYAAFRVPGDRQSEGYEEYDWIFTHSPELLRVHGVVIGERAMRDYAYTLTTQYGPRRQEGPKESKNVLLHAIAQQISFVRAGDETDGSIDWNGAIRQAGCATEVYELASAAVADPRCPKTFELYRIAAFAAEDLNASYAKTMYSRAEGMLSGQPKRVVTEFSYSEAGFLQRQGLLDQVLKVERRRIEKTGSGRDNLALTLLAQNRRPEYERVVRDIVATPDPAADALNLAAALMNKSDTPEGDKGLLSDSKNILCALRCRRDLAPETALQCALQLAECYLRMHDTNSAKRVLDLPETTMRPRSERCKAIIRQIIELRNNIPKNLKDSSEEKKVK